MTNENIRIINDDAEIEKFITPNVAPVYRIRFFLSYHPRAFRLIILNPSDKTKTDFEMVTEAIITIPEFNTDYEPYHWNIEIRFLDHNKKMIDRYNMDIDDSTLDFKGEINVEEITETIVYFYYFDKKNTFYKFNSYKSTVVDNRSPEKFIHPVPESIERISHLQYVPCITQEFKEIPRKKIPHDKIFLIETYYVERMNLEHTDELIILPQEATIDQSNELQIGDVEKYNTLTYSLNNLKTYSFLTLQGYEQHIDESKQKFRGITLTSKTKNGFNLHDIIYRFELIKQRKIPDIIFDFELTEEKNIPDFLMIMIMNPVRYLGLCNAAFRDSLLAKGFEQEKIFEYTRRYLSGRFVYAYYFNNSDRNSYDEMVVQYFGVDKVLEYRLIINNALLIEVDKDLYFIHR